MLLLECTVLEEYSSEDGELDIPKVVAGSKTAKGLPLSAKPPGAHSQGKCVPWG